MPDADLNAKVLVDLKRLRKNLSGVTVQTIAGAKTLCRLLGSGDPYLAYTRLQHILLDATSDRTVRAAAASLGFSSGSETHLARLEDAGVELGGVDQRQARRLSDKGLEAIATLIASNWTIESVPAFSVTVTGALDGFVIYMSFEKPSIVEMTDPEIEVWVGDKKTTPDLVWQQSCDNDVDTATCKSPLSISRSEYETSVVIVWRGELWPKFGVRWVGDIDGAAVESLGNKLMLRLVHAPGE